MMIIGETKIYTFLHDFFVNLSRHFLPFGRADLTSPASLRPIRGGKPQLHGPRLAYEAISTRE